MCMHVSEASYTLNVERFDALTERLGCTDDQQKAATIGVSRSTLSRIRRGKIQPGARFIAQATSSLGVSVEYLFGRAQGRS